MREHPLKWLAIIVSVLAVLFVVLAGVVPMLMEASDFSRIRNVAFAIDKITGEGYRVLAAEEVIDWDIIPSDNNTYDIGSLSAQWAEGHFAALYINGVAVNASGGGGSGANNFTDLGDTPSSYTGQSGNYVRVNAGEDGLEFVEGGNTNFTDLEDTPADYSGHGGNYIRIKATEDGLEFVATNGSGVTEFTELNDAPSSYTGNATQMVRVNSGEDGLEFVNSGVTLTIAASDSSAAAKAYALLSGGYVCNGTNDEVYIEAALADVGQWGTVQAAIGHYYLDTTLDSDESAFLEGSGKGTVVNITGTNYVGINITSTGADELIGRLSHCQVQAPDNFANIAVLVMSKHQTWGALILDDITIRSYEGRDNTTASIGLQIRVYSDGGTGNHHIIGCTFNEVVVWSFETAGHLYNYRRTSGETCINSNNFINCRWLLSRYLLDIELDQDGGVVNTNGNHFIGNQFEPRWNGGTNYGIRMITDSGNSPRSNSFTDCQFWDLSDFDINTIMLQSGSYQNYFDGHLGAYRQDVGALTLIDDQDGRNIFNDTPKDLKLIGDLSNPGWRHVWGDALMQVGTSGEAISWGEVVYRKESDGKWYKAQADSAAEVRAQLGIAGSAPTAADQDMNVILQGFLDITEYDFTAEYQPIYLSAATAGQITQTVPSGANQFIRCLGVGIDSDVCFFKPSCDYYELDANGDVSKINGVDTSSSGDVYLSDLASDNTYTGVTTNGTAGESLVFGQVCYLKSDGKYWKTQANSSSTTAGLIVVAAATISADAIGIFICPGSIIRDDAWSFTIGATLYVSNSTAGAIMSTAPAATGDQVRIIGYAGVDNDDGTIYFLPDATIVEIS